MCSAGASREVPRSVFFDIAYPALEYLGSVMVYGPEDRAGGPAYQGYFEALDLQALAKAQGGRCLNGRYEVYWKPLPDGMNAARFRTTLLSRFKTGGYAVRAVGKPGSIQGDPLRQYDVPNGFYRVDRGTQRFVVLVASRSSSFSDGSGGDNISLAACRIK